MTFGQLFTVMNPDVNICENGTCVWIFHDDVNHYTMGLEWWNKEIPDHAIAMLKEQSEIVRCEDCKHRPTYPKAYGAEINGRWCYWCELLMAWKPDDWFCANGKRR